MKMKEARDERAFYSGKLSDIIRQLGLTGLAVIWFFSRNQLPNESGIPKWLIPAGLFILLSLAFDLLHYAAGARFWRDFIKRKDLEIRERQEIHGSIGGSLDTDSVDFSPPEDRDTWPNRFFRLKLATILLAYGFLIPYVGFEAFH